MSTHDVGIDRFLHRVDLLRERIDRDGGITWLVAGDSVAAGGRHTAGGRSWAELLAERARVELARTDDVVVVTAVGGWSAEDLLGRLEDAVTRFKPDVVHVGLGFNDARVGGADGASAFGDTLARVLDAIEATGALPVVQGPNATLPTVTAPVHEVIGSYRDAALAAAQTLGVPAIDHLALWQGLGERVYHGWIGHGCHPNAFGHRMLARSTFAALGWDDPDSATVQLDVPGAPRILAPGRWSALGSLAGGRSEA